MTQINTILIIGLGNPGEKFSETRHNIGFRIIDYFRKQNGFPQWKKSNLLRAKISKRIIGDNSIFVAQPQTFMNNSGLAVEKIKRKLGIDSKDIIVCHDDLDIDFGTIKISKDKKSAGHKGVNSIIESIKTKNFVRIRFGIKPKHILKDTKTFVLEKFNKNEEKVIDNLLPQLNQAMLLIIKDGFDKTISKYGKLTIKDK